MRSVRITLTGLTQETIQRGARRHSFQQASGLPPLWNGLLEAAKLERERQLKMAELEQRQREAEAQKEFRERQLENARQIAEWQRDPFAYADHFGLW